MSVFKVFLIVALGLIALTSHVEAMCSVCTMTSYAACTNETAFVVCYDGKTLSNQTISCSEGMVCTDQQGICKPKESAVLGCAMRSMCNECVNTFACISKTVFAYCDESGVFTVTASCPQGYYCSIADYMNQGNICMPSCVTEPTCSNAEVVTTPAPELDWRETCQSVSSAGFYKNIHDSTCKTYVYCEMYNNVMDAVYYKCASGYFNQSTQKCQATQPTGCK